MDWTKYSVNSTIVIMVLPQFFNDNHHWQEIAIASLFGISVIYVCYRRHYSSKEIHLPVQKKNKTFIDLNDDCLEYLFKFLDAESIAAVSETCKRLKWIAEDQFKHYTSYDCVIQKNVSAASKVFSKMGKNLRKLSITFKHMSVGDDTFKLKTRNEIYTYFDIHDGRGFFDLIYNSIDDNLAVLCLKGGVSEMPIQILGPKLRQLESLSLCANSLSETAEIDLPALCPKLKRLKISGPLLFAPNQYKAFPSLEQLVFLPFNDIHQNYSPDFFVAFREQNRQLKAIRISIDQFYASYLHEEMLHSLRGLRAHLVSEARIMADLDLNLLFDLNVEGITVNGWHSESMWKIPQSIDNSKWKQLRFFESNNGKPQIVVPVVRAAKNLEMIRIGLDCNITPKLITDIAEARYMAVAVTKPPLKICFHAETVKTPAEMINRIQDYVSKVKKSHKSKLVSIVYKLLSHFFFIGFEWHIHEINFEKRLCN